MDAITLARPVRLIFETVLAPSFVVKHRAGVDHEADRLLSGLSRSWISRLG